MRPWADNEMNSECQRCDTSINLNVGPSGLTSLGRVYHGLRPWLFNATPSAFSHSVKCHLSTNMLMLLRVRITRYCLKLFWSRLPSVRSHTLPIICPKRRGRKVNAIVEIHFRIISPRIPHGYGLQHFRTRYHDTLAIDPRVGPIKLLIYSGNGECFRWLSVRCLQPAGMSEANPHLTVLDRVRLIERT